MYKSIQYLRGVAAIAVVFKHASHPGGSLETMLDGGVDLFFIISGFVMVASTQGRNMGPLEFLSKRAKRIFPIWWVTLIVVAALGLGRGNSIAWLMSFFLIPTTVSYGMGAVSWGVGWTLVFEMVFYLFFAIGLAIKSEIFVGLALISLVISGQVFGHSSIPIVRDLTNSILLEFLFGMAIAKFVRPTEQRYAFALLAFSIAAYAVAAGTHLPRVLALGVPLAFAVAALVGLERYRELPNLVALRFFGDASYSIYLFHYVAIMLAWQFVAQNSYWPLVAGGGIAFGSIAYVALEKPLLNLTGLVARRILGSAFTLQKASTLPDRDSADMSHDRSA